MKVHGIEFLIGPGSVEARNQLHFRSVLIRVLQPILICLPCFPSQTKEHSPAFCVLAISGR